MTCPACGAENPVAAKFCEECGAQQPRRCPSCAHEISATAKFCLDCGERLGEAPPPGPASSAPVAPRTYTPRHLAEKILASRTTLEGERKQVTVLFADVVGSTELIRDRDPEDAQRLLDGVVQRMMGAVHHYEGTVSRLMGDGLMAMFGAPVAHEDHAVRACYAALAMLDSARTYADDLRRAQGVTIQIRVGINSGEVIVRLISDDLHMDYTAMGQTVHLASRMEGLAEAGSALLTPSTLALVEGYVEMRPLGPREVKGFDQPIKVSELVGAGAARTRLQATAARGLTPFIGREAERAALSGALAQARTGQGQVVALVAEAGVGKSRLVWEATRPEHAQDARVLQTGAVSYGQTTAWLPAIDLLRSYFQIESRDDHAAMRVKITAHVQALDPALDRHLPAVLALLDVPVEDGAWATLDPPQRRRATLDAVRHLLLREGQRQPLLLVFEDLHWLDSETQALLDSLVEVLPTASILLLVNYRPEYAHTWANRSYYTQLRIDPLGQQRADELLDALLGDDPTVLPLKGLLIRRTEGTPLFLEESVRALVETGALAGEPGAFRLAHLVDEIRVPATVQAVLAARIDRLSNSAKQLLQTAAVIGKDVPFPLLQAISETSETELDADLSRLQSAELLYPLSLFPELELTFKHALTHDVAYGSLLQGRRKVLHARIVEAIERLHPDRLDEHVERLAHHATRAESWEQAARYCQQAGERAAARSAYRETAGHVEAALVALGKLPPQLAVREAEIDLRLDLRHALAPLGQEERLFEILREAESMAIALGDRARTGRAASQLAYILFLRGDLEDAAECAQRALQIGDELGDLALQVAARIRLTEISEQQGDFRRACEHARWMLASVPEGASGRLFGTTVVPAAQFRSMLATSLAQLGEFDEATRMAFDAVRAADAADHPFSQAMACCNVGVAVLPSGDFGAAIEILERGRLVCETWGIWSFNQVTISLLAYAYVLAGRPDDGVQLVEEVERRAVTEGRLRNLLDAPLRRTETLLAAGRLDEAHVRATQLLAYHQSVGEHANRAWVLRLLGEIAMRRDPPGFNEAETHHRQALALAEESEMRPLQARCHLGLGTLFRRIGRLDEARSELSTAVVMLREMGMALWLPEAEAELAQVGSQQ